MIGQCAIKVHLNVTARMMREHQGDNVERDEVDALPRTK